MKLRICLKRFLCLLVVCATLLLTCACELDDIGIESGEETGTPNGASAEIVISSEPSFRIVYSSAYKTQAKKIADKLIKLDKSYVKDSGKYELALDTEVPADGTPEIIIGITNRKATAEAKKLVSGKKNYYAIYVTNTEIALYANSKTGIDAGITALLKKFSEKDGKVIYDNSKGNITGKYTVAEKETTAIQVSPIAATRTPEKTDIDATKLLNALKGAAGSKAYSIAVSTTEGIQVAKIRNTDPQNSYSVSKVFCVTAIGMLYDEGKITPYDKIGDIFKDEIKAYGIDENRWKNITVHDVLRHEVGFKQGGLLDIDADPSLLNKHDDFLKVVLSYELNGNKSHKYTDAAYYLISRVVSKVSGQKLDVYLKSRLFDVAGFQNYKIVKCPQGYPIGATQFYLRPDDIAKLGRIYLNGGTYNGKRIISQKWVNTVIENGYELKPNYNGYAKGGMRGQYIYVNFEHNVAVAWLSETDGGTANLYDKLKEYLP